MSNDNMIDVIIENDGDPIRKGDVIIKQMGQLTSDIMNYKFAYDNYEGNRDIILEEKTNIIRNTLAVLLSDIDIYTKMLGITESLERKKRKRLSKIVKKITSI